MSGRCCSRRSGGLSPLSPLLPLLLSLARAATPPPAPAPAAGRQLLQQVIQSAIANASPVRPLQALQSAASTSPLLVLEAATPVRPLQALSSQLPVRPLVSLQGRPGISWLQNSKPANALYNAAVGVAVGESSADGSAPPPALPPPSVLDEDELSASLPTRRRRRSLDPEPADGVTEDLLADAAEELVGAPVPVVPVPAEKAGSRQEKALHYLNMGGGYLAVSPVDEMGSPMGGAGGMAGGMPDLSALDLDEAGLTLADEGGNELLSRAAPFRKPDSPIYYIRLPPSPYVLVPGVGYVSSPPQRRPLGAMAAAPPPPPPPPAAAPAAGSSSFYNLPLAFMSNGKPTGVYQPSWGMSQAQRPPRPQVRPPPQLAPQQTFTLNKGPYVFNGRPSDIFILRDSFDTLYGDALSSFYP